MAADTHGPVIVLKAVKDITEHLGVQSWAEQGAGPDVPVWSPL